MISTTADPTPRKRGVLSREHIIDVAIAVIDVAGFDGLTMRKLGHALGVDAMSVYGYFANKAELLDAVVEHEAQRLATLPEPYPADPIEFLVGLGVHYRTVLLEHPNLAPLVASRPLPQSNWRATVTLGVAVFRAAQFDDDLIPLAADAMIGFALGFIVHEASQRRLRAELGERIVEHQAEIRRQLGELRPDQTVEARLIEQRLTDYAAAEQFKAGLRAMLCGLRNGLGTPEAAR